MSADTALPFTVMETLGIQLLLNALSSRPVGRSGAARRAHERL
jgi:hypothetical protein